MECLSPIWLSNEFLSENKDRSGRAFIEGGKYVPCGKCVSCLERKRSIWTFRMMQENKDAGSGYFVTLTYDQENIPVVELFGRDFASLWFPDLQLFIKRLRSNIQRYTKVDEDWFKKSEKTGKWSPKVRYFACGEYGSRGDRPHYHIIIWNLPPEYVDFDPIHDKKYSELIEQTWNKGIVDIGEVEQRSCHYVAKYTLDAYVNWWHEKDIREKPFATMSRNPGIGSNYSSDEIKRYFDNNKNSYSLGEDNIKQPIGRYLMEKVYEGNDDSKRAAVRKAEKIAKQNNEERLQGLLDGKKGKDAEKYLLEVKREQREGSDRKIKRIIKSGKL